MKGETSNFQLPTSNFQLPTSNFQLTPDPWPLAPGHVYWRTGTWLVVPEGVSNFYKNPPDVNKRPVAANTKVRKPALRYSFPSNAQSTGPMMTQPKPRTRPRFSLLTLLLLSTIVALGVGLYSSARRNTRLADKNAELVAENKTYRDELGVFDIEDPTKMHVIRVPTDNGEPRKYRLWLPPGKKYYCCYRSDNIPERNVPSRTNMEVLEPGHYLFRVEVERLTDKENNPQPIANFIVHHERTGGEDRDASSCQVSVRERNLDWIVNQQTGGMTYGWSELGRELKLHDPDQPLVLYCARAHRIKVRSRNDDGTPSIWSHEQVPGETEGFMLWIESEPLKDGN